MYCSLCCFHVFFLVVFFFSSHLSLSLLRFLFFQLCFILVRATKRSLKSYVESEKCFVPLFTLVCLAGDGPTLNWSGRVQLTIKSKLTRLQIHFPIFFVNNFTFFLGSLAIISSFSPFFFYHILNSRLNGENKKQYLNNTKKNEHLEVLNHEAIFDVDFNA